MKKLVLLLLILILLLVAAIYIFIPGRMALRKTENVAVSSKAFTRIFPDENRWKAWWPGEVNAKEGKQQGFQLNGNSFFIRGKRLTSLLIDIDTGDEVIFSELVFIPVNDDSINLVWGAQSVASNNPFTRISYFFISKDLEKDMAMILQKIKAFYQNESNLYNVEIKKDRVVDSTLISTRITTDTFPSIEIIYSLIDKLQAFAAKNGAKQTGLPMLNIYTSDSITFRTQVALPVDKKLKDEDDITYRWMLGGGNILVAEVKGGPSKINKVFTEMENYVTDFRRTAPAIPFQSLVTDRRKETDTSKWVTKIYWPVM